MKWGSWELRFQLRTIGTGWSMKKICFGTSGNEKDMLWNGLARREKGVSASMDFSLGERLYSTRAARFASMTGIITLWLSFKPVAVLRGLPLPVFLNGLPKVVPFLRSGVALFVCRQSISSDLANYSTSIRMLHLCRVDARLPRCPCTMELLRLKSDLAAH